MNSKKGELSVKNSHDGSREIIGEFYEGIIPSPEMMKGYYEFDPSLPGRLLKWKEDEAKHRQEMERIIVSQTYRSEIIGNVFGFLSIIALGVLSYLFMDNGYPAEGKWIAISIASVVSIFVIKKVLTFQIPKKSMEKKNHEDRPT